MAVLLAAEKISRAAKLKIEGGDAEACAQVTEFFERGEPLARD